MYIAENRPLGLLHFFLQFINQTRLRILKKENPGTPVACRGFLKGFKRRLVFMIGNDALNLIFGTENNRHTLMNVFWTDFHNTLTACA